MDNLTHVDLFSGIGGFALAAHWAGIKTVQFVEIDQFCQKVLNKNFPGVPIHDDIKTFTYTTIKYDGGYQGGTEERQEPKSGSCVEQEANTNANGNGLQGPWAKLKTDGNRQFVQERPSYSRNIRPAPFILTGGFPCQPFSCAGKRRGKEDDRYLWPETIRVVRHIKPRWLVFENVLGLGSMVQQYSPTKLESKTVQRLARSDLYRAIFTRQELLLLGIIIQDIEEAGYQLPQLKDGTPVIPVIPACAKNAPHRRDRVWIVANCIDEGCFRWSGRGDTNGSWVQESKPSGGESRGAITRCWQEPWLAAATRLCTLDDGLPGGLVRPRGWRVNALKAAGNAIVPQIAYEIMKAIVDTGETF